MEITLHAFTSYTHRTSSSSGSAVAFVQNPLKNIIMFVYIHRNNMIPDEYKYLEFRWKR